MRLHALPAAESLADARVQAACLLLLRLEVLDRRRHDRQHQIQELFLAARRPDESAAARAATDVVDFPELNAISHMT